MTDERAMEILDPDHREHYESIEPINEACRIGIAAIKRVKELEAENAELKSSLTHANEECLKWHERAQNLLKDSGGSISGYEKKVSDLQAENVALRERLGKAVELENKINNGELVDAIWFKSWINGQICCGSVIGYSDGCFVIACGDDLISANKIYTSREQARYGLDKKINKKEE